MINWKRMPGYKQERKKAILWLFEKLLKSCTGALKACDSSSETLAESALSDVGNGD